MLCGKDGSIDLTDFLDQSIQGPGRFECTQKHGGTHDCAFKEPEMDALILALIGDSSIFLDCHAGECLYETEVPGWKRPVKKINTPLIASVIAGCSLFLVAVIILTWYLSRRKLNYGAIRLEDSDDESTKLMADHKPASLYFDDVAYSLNGKQILTGIRGICKPGEVTAIMGASGAGKTTFLDILARKNKRGQVNGNFYVNGERLTTATTKTLSDSWIKRILCSLLSPFMRRFLPVLSFDSLATWVVRLRSNEFWKLRRNSASIIFVIP